MKLILDLCGGIGSWSKPYLAAGYQVKIITLPEYDVTDELTVQYCIGLRPHGILCATPCECWGMMGNCQWQRRTKEFIVLHTEILIKNLRIIYESNPSFWCIENPPGKLSRFLGKPHFAFDPYEFGAPYHKRTFLWGKFNRPKELIFNNHPSIHKYIQNVTGKNRSEIRAITPIGFAQAFFEANP
jgi:hypothetical protein